MRQVNGEDTAEISDCGQFRYILTRKLRGDLGPCIFGMLNPSDADAFEDDPTVGRCIDFGNEFRCSELLIFNLSPLRAKDPKELKDFVYPQSVIDENWKWILKCLRLATLHEDGQLIAAWGNNALDHDICKYFKEKIKASGAKLSTLKENMTGEPSHPLYLLSTCRPMPYQIK